METAEPISSRKELLRRLRCGWTARGRRGSALVRLFAPAVYPPPRLRGWAKKAPLEALVRAGLAVFEPDGAGSGVWRAAELNPVARQMLDRRRQGEASG